MVCFNVHQYCIMVSRIYHSGHGAVVSKLHAYYKNSCFALAYLLKVFMALLCSVVLINPLLLISLLSDYAQKTLICMSVHVDVQYCLDGFMIWCLF